MLIAVDRPERICNAGGVRHLLLELVDVGTVLLQALMDGFSEGVNGDKVWEEGEQILDLDQPPRISEQVIDL